jgi:CBS domain-containing protein
VTLLHEHETTGLPVVAADGAEPVGWLDHRDVLAAYAAVQAEASTTVVDPAPGTGTVARTGST